MSVRQPAVPAAASGTAGFDRSPTSKLAHSPTNGLSFPKATRLSRMFFICSPAMEQGSLFPDPRPAVTDDELVAVFRCAISHGGRLSRTADLYLTAICAEHLVHELRVAGLEVVRAAPARLRE